MSPNAARRVLEGQRAAPGMALGRVRLQLPHRHNIDASPLPADAIEHELARLDAALARARGELTELRQRLHGALAREAQPFLDTHALILDDPELRGGLIDLIRKGRYRAGAALVAQRDRLIEVFRRMDDAYLRARASAASRRASSCSIASAGSGDASMLCRCGNCSRTRPSAMPGAAR